MSPRTGWIPVALLGGLMLGGCGEPPRPLPTSPPFSVPSSGPLSGAPTLPPPVGGGQVLPTTPGTGLTTTYPAYPTYPGIPGYATPPPIVTPTTTAPTTKSPTPTPARAGKCATQPTAAQILALIKGKPAIPAGSLRIQDGPYCSGTWSFSTVEETGKDTDEVEPLFVITTGKGSTLTLVAAGSDVCLSRVQTEAPAGIRVMACGF